MRKQLKLFVLLALISCGVVLAQGTKRENRLKVSSMSIPADDTLSLSSGAVTPDAGYHLVDEEVDGTADDLDTLTPTNATSGWLLILRLADEDATVTAKDATGNLQLEGDFAMDQLDDVLTLIWTGVDLDGDSTLDWAEISRTNGS